MQGSKFARRAGQSLLVVALVTACGGGSGGGGGGASTAAGVGSGTFTVLQTDPLDGATGVPLDHVVRVTFSGEVDPATVTTASLTLAGPQGPVAARLGFARGAGASSVVTLTPTATLSATTTYGLRIDGSVADTARTPLGAERRSTFTTGVWTGLEAGVSVVDVTPPIGVPVGGFGEPPRRIWPPDFNPNNYHTLLAPSQGMLDPIQCKTLVLRGNGRTVAIITLDLIATASQAVQDIQARAAARGVTIALDDLLVCSSHTHSGPGTLSNLRFWELVGMDLFQRSIYDAFLDRCVDGLIQAHASLAPAKLGSDSTTLTGIARNRRAGDSPVFTRDSLDPELAVIRVDRADGTPLVTLWSYAIHGLLYMADNMHFSADLFGFANRHVEAGGGGTALYANGAEGDVTPLVHGTADGDALGQLIAAEVLALRGRITTSSTIDLRSASEWVDWQSATVSVDVSRLGRAGSGNAFVRALQAIPGFTFGIGIPLRPTWCESRFRFQAIRLGDVVISSIPGEAIHTVGLAVKAHGQARGFRKTFVFGLANGHMAYITTPQEYDAGGYESIATLFGRDTGTKVIDRCVRAIDLVR